MRITAWWEHPRAQWRPWWLDHYSVWEQTSPSGPRQHWAWRGPSLRRSNLPWSTEEQLKPPPAFLSTNLNSRTNMLWFWLKIHYTTAPVEKIIYSRRISVVQGGEVCPIQPIILQPIWVSQRVCSGQRLFLSLSRFKYRLVGVMKCSEKKEMHSLDA